MQISAWRYRRFHISHVLGWLAAALMAGIAFAQLGTLQLSPVILISLVFLLLLLLRRRRWWSVVGVVVCGLILGWVRGSDMLLSLRPYEAFEGQMVTVQGIITDDPQYGDRGDQRFRVAQVWIDGVSLPGEVYVGTYSILDVKRGDKVTLKGTLGDGFGNFQASLRYATLSEATAAHDPIREFRDTFATGVRNAVEEPSASLGIGYVVGQRSALPEDLDDQLRIVGLTHIVVASGYNLTILVRFSRRLLEKHSKYLAAASSGGLMVGFAGVSGMSPSMTRASLVTGLSLLAWYYGRRFHPLLIILYAAAFTAYMNPLYLWADVGWYLSFLAFAGVLIVAPLLGRLAFREKKPSALLQVVIETIAAQLMTLPIILLIFGDLPVLSVISNALVAPTIPLAMLLTVIAGFWGMLLPVSAGFVGTAAEIVLGYTVAVVQWLSSPSWAQISMQLSPSVMVIAYIMIALGTLWLWRRLRYDFRSSSVVE